MSRILCLTPAGRLCFEESAEQETELASAVVEQLEGAFEKSSADGLVLLAMPPFESQLPAALVFWREFSHRFFQAVCRLGEDFNRKWEQLKSPTREECESILSAAPPMRGLEYLSFETLTALWNELAELVAQQAAKNAEGPTAYLRGVNPIWNLLGRVTFHLAENKKNPERPFAFLATYTHRVAAGSRLQHLPLAEALKEYAGEKNKERLTSLLEPVRRAADASELARELLQSKALFQPQSWTIQHAHRFLTEVPRMEAAGIVVRVPDWWRSSRRATRPQIQVRLGEKPASAVGAGSMLDFSIDVALDGEPLTEAERRELMRSTESMMLLRGRWVEVDRNRLQEALSHWEHLQERNPDGLTFIEGMRLLSGVQLDQEEEADATPEWSQVVAGDWLRESLETLRSPGGVDDLQPGIDLQATLRPYQSDGVRWLWFMTRLGIGACLADDMGLGKTIQVIDLLLQLKRARVKDESKVSLLVVPSSLIGNWKQELAKFAPSLRVFLAHRSECEAGELERVAATPQKSLADIDLVITTYGLARRGQWLSEVPWRLVILDEAQAIKNGSSNQTRAVKKLRGTSRIVLTGTPVENHLGDLWSLFDFCSPGLLGSATQFRDFVKRLNKKQDATAFGALRRLVRPYILRRMKTDPNIVPDLPDKTEVRAECGLSKKQVALYQAALTDLQQRLENAEGIARSGLVLAMLMQLKQICNHPSQYLKVAHYAPEESAKFQRLAEICEPVIERQEKMLVFTQFQSLCEPLAEFLQGVFGRPGLVLSGKTAVGKRSGLVKEFQADGGPPFFVISVKAGGSGLNLTAASHVVHFDRWWNPAVENQATDRAFRIGQKRNVLVHKFVCRGTVEERIDQLIRDKQGLSDQLLDQGGEALLTQMSDQELLNFVAIDLNRAAEES